MIFRVVLLFTYLMLRLAFKLAAALDPRFKSRLAERDLTFVVRSSTGSATGVFKLEGGELTYGGSADGFVNFSAVWNGWGEADTLGKKLRLNAMDLMNQGMMTFEGDLSSMDYLLVLLGEMLASFRRRESSRLERAELGRKPS